MGAEKADPRILAGEFVLADADGDGAKAGAILARVQRGEIGSMQFILALTALAAESLQLAFGEAWRDRLNESLLGLSVEEVARDVDGE